MLEEFAARHKVVGVKQSAKAVASGAAAQVFFADDADPAVLRALEERCAAGGIPVTRGYTLAQLGAAAGISVGAAVVTLLKA